MVAAADTETAGCSSGALWCVSADICACVSARRAAQMRERGSSGRRHEVGHTPGRWCLQVATMAAGNVRRGCCDGGATPVPRGVRATRCAQPHALLHHHLHRLSPSSHAPPRLPPALRPNRLCCRRPISCRRSHRRVGRRRPPLRWGFSRRAAAPRAPPQHAAEELFFAVQNTLGEYSQEDLDLSAP